MNPLILFDYICYRIAYVYGKMPGYRYTDTKIISAVIILSLLQFVNILDLLNILEVRNNLLKIFPNYSFVIGFITLCILNYFRYIRLLKFSEFESKWDNEDRIKRHTKSVLIIVYFLLSFYLLAPR
jgi:hypothetical protein